MLSSVNGVVYSCHYDTFLHCFFRESLNIFDPASRAEAEVKLHLLKNICGTSQSFSEKFNFSANRGAPAEDKSSETLNRTSTIRDLMNLITQVYPTRHAYCI